MNELWNYLPTYLNGFVVTLTLMLGALSVGMVLAVLMTFCSFSENIIFTKLISCFIFLTRGTPLLVQIFLLYYGAGQFEWLRASPLWILLSEPMACAVIVLALNSACYTTILFQGAIRSVPKAEVDACYALGMSKWLALRRIIFPRALMLALPAYSNEVVMVLKATSLASTITLLDLFGVTQQIINDTYQPVPFYILVACIYLALNAIISGIFKFVFLLNKTYQQSGASE